jgi:hypothetical protein
MLIRYMALRCSEYCPVREAQYFRLRVKIISILGQNKGGSFIRTRCRHFIRTGRPETAKHCDVDLAVQIEKGLPAKSPENGNITQMGWRLSAISREGCRFSGRGDTPHNARKPIFSGLFVIWLRTILS